MLRHYLLRVQSRRHIIFTSLPTYPSSAWGFNMGFPICLTGLGLSL